MKNKNYLYKIQRVNIILILFIVNYLLLYFLINNIQITRLDNNFIYIIAGYMPMFLAILIYFAILENSVTININLKKIEAFILSILLITIVVAVLNYGLPKYNTILQSFIFAPIVEEVFYRGIIQQELDNLIKLSFKYKAIIVIVTTNILFTINHTVSYSSINNLVLIFILGSIISIVFMYTKSLYNSRKSTIIIPIFLHILYNILTILA